MATVVDAGMAGALAPPCRQLPSVTSSSSPCVVGMGVRVQGRNATFPACRGLRISLRPKVSAVAVRAQSQGAKGIVSEAQETVTGVDHNAPAPA